MMKLTGNKIFSFMLAAAFALTLAGCGGGGGGSAAAPDPDPTPMPSPQEMCEADGGRYNADGSCTSADDLAEEMALSGAQEAAMAAYMMAMGYAGSAKDPVAMGKAQMYAGMAKDASDAAAMATTSEMAMEYQMKAEMNRDMAMEAAMMRGLGLTMLANKISSTRAISTNDELEGNDPRKPVSIKCTQRGHGNGDGHKRSGCYSYWIAAASYYCCWSDEPGRKQSCHQVLLLEP